MWRYECLRFTVKLWSILSRSFYYSATLSIKKRNVKKKINKLHLAIWYISYRLANSYYFHTFNINNIIHKLLCYVRPQWTAFIRIISDYVFAFRIEIHKRSLFTEKRSLYTQEMEATIFPFFYPKYQSITSFFSRFHLPFSYHQVPEFIGKSWFSCIAPSHRNTSKNLVSKSTKQMETATCCWIRSSEYGKYGACGPTFSSCACAISWRWKWWICTTSTPSEFNVFLLSARW